MSKDTPRGIQTAAFSPPPGASTHQGVGVCRNMKRNTNYCVFMMGRGQLRLDLPCTAKSRIELELVQTHSSQSAWQQADCADMRNISLDMSEPRNRTTSGASVAKYSHPSVWILLNQS